MVGPNRRPNTGSTHLRTTGNQERKSICRGPVVTTFASITESERRGECAENATMSYRYNCRGIQGEWADGYIYVVCTGHTTQEKKKRGEGYSIDGSSRECVSDRFESAKCDHVHRYCPEGR
jgi:hypothetical protein